MGRIGGLGGCWMDGGWWMVEIWGELEGKEKHSSLDLISSGSLCKHPVEDGLDHNDKNDEEDKVSVQVGVAVPLLLLVETHLDAMVEFSNTVADVLLLLNERR